MSVPSCLKIERGSDGAHDFKLNKVPLFSRKSVNMNVSLSAAPTLAIVPASRWYCDVNWSYHNVCAKFPLDRKRFRWGRMTSNLTSAFLALKSVYISVSMSAAPKVALVPASRYYCDVNWSYLNVCAKFH